MSDIHDQLIEVLRKYFEAHLKWETKRTTQSAMDARAYLSEMRKIAVLRREEIQQQRQEKGISKRHKGQPAEVLRQNNKKIKPQAKNDDGPETP